MTRPMHEFEVGDRVKVDRPGNEHHGRQGEVIKLGTIGSWPSCSIKVAKWGVGPSEFEIPERFLRRVDDGQAAP